MMRRMTKTTYFPFVTPVASVYSSVRGL
jgi:hypothetical protein